MAADADKVAQAKAIWRAAQDAALAASPLREMEAWVAAGRPPAAAALAAQGFAGALAPTQQSQLVRGGFNRRWGFSIPGLEAVEALAALGPLVEVGCGTGYWSALLRNAGLDVIATDLIASGDPGYGFTVGRCCEVTAMGAAEAAAAFPERAVFCSWPTREDAWAVDMVRALGPGRALALIAEPADGRTASAALYDELARDFSLVRAVEIPQFPGARDRLYLCRRN